MSPAALKILKRTGAVLLGFLVLLAALAAFALWLVLTPEGLTFAAHQAERFVPGFRLERVEGDWRDLRLVNLAYQAEGIDAAADEIRLGIDVDKLFEKTIIVKNVSLAGVRAQINTAALGGAEPEPEEAPAAPFDPSVVPDFSVESIELTNVEALVDARAVRIERFAARIDWARGALAVPTVTLRSLSYEEPGISAGLAHLETAFDWNGRIAALPKFVLEDIRAKVPGAEGAVKRLIVEASADATTAGVEQLDLRRVLLEGLDARLEVPQPEASAAAATLAATGEEETPEQLAKSGEAAQQAASDAVPTAEGAQSGEQIAASQKASEGTPAKLLAPFPIRAADIALRDLSVNAYGSAAHLESFETGLEWQGSMVVVKPVRVKGLAAKLAEGAETAAPLEKPAAAPQFMSEEDAQIPPGGRPSQEEGGDAAENAAGAKKGPGEMLEALFDAPFIRTLPAVALPLDVTLEGFEASDWRLEGIPGAQDLKPLSPFLLERLVFRASLLDGHASLEGLKAQTSAFSLEASADAHLKGDWQAKAHAEIAADVAPFAPALGLARAPAALRLDLDGALLGKLSASLSLSGPVAATAQLSAEIARANLPFEASIEVPGLKWPLPGAKLEGASAAAPAGEAAKTPESKASKAASQKTAEAPSSGQAADSKFELKDFAFVMGGSVKDWHADMKGALTADMPSAGLKKPLSADLSLRAAGTPSRAKIEDLSLTTEIGRLALSGNAAWLRNLEWEAAARVEGVDAKKLMPKLPLTLDFNTSASGAVGLLERPGSWRVKLSNLTADGLIQGGLIRLRGTAVADSDRHAEIPGLFFTLGKNNLSLKGKADNVRDISLELKVDVPGLLNTIPGLKGTASGYVRLSGSAFRPAVAADLRADGLGWQSSFGIDAVRLKADVKNRVERRMRRPPAVALPAQAANAGKAEEAREQPAGAAQRPRRPRRIFTAEETMNHIAEAIASGELEGNLNLAVKGIRVGETTVREVNFTTKGRETAMQLALRISGGPVEGEVGVKGGLNRSTLDWKGSLTGTHFSTPAGRWAQKRDIALDFRFADLTLGVGAHCWTNENAEVCLAQPMRLGRSGSAKVKLEKLDMAILKPYLRRRDKVEGVVTGEADVDWDLDRASLPNVRVSLTGDGLKGQTRYQGIRFPVTLERLRLRAALVNGQASAGVEVRPEGDGLITGSFTVDDIEGERRLGGRLTIEEVTPSLLKPFFAQGETAAGRMNADLQAGGTLKSPELFGDFKLEQLSFDATYLPIDMKPSDLLLHFAGQSSKLDAALKTGTGDVRITGSAEWRDLADWRASVAVESDKIRVSMPPMIEVDVQTDVKAEATPALISLTGTVDVPWANITVGELPASGVSVSKDEVMLDENLNPVVTPSSPIALKSSVLVKIGDRVSIDAFGLKAGLTGGIYIVQNDDKLGLNGQIKIPYGRFHAYGQDLLIRKGTIFFTGPAENPSLDIEAIRNPDATEDDVTAGIRVGGTAANPKVTLFSDPAKSQSETLSYLIRGQGLGSDDEGGSSAMTSMLIGLGATTGNGIMTEIGDTLGIEGLGLDTTGVGESSQVVVSGYVLPGLQVKYGVGIFDSLATLTLRYRLMPRLYLEAVSSVDQALDLLYRFDF